MQAVCGLMVALPALMAVHEAQSIRFHHCGPKGEQIILDITPCPSLPCLLHKGQTYSVNVTWGQHAQPRARQGVATVHGILVGISVPFLIPNSDGCKSGIQCPRYINSLPMNIVT
ncbi:NPC intracellular cholesterol transporter 2-like [Mustelus asterias]